MNILCKLGIHNWKYETISKDGKSSFWNCESSAVHCVESSTLTHKLGTVICERCFIQKEYSKFSKYVESKNQ